MATIEIGASYGYVLGVAAASYVVHQIWMSMKVVDARKKYKVQYPDLYATPENCKDEVARKTFNCVQRAHQNSLEVFASNLALLLVAGTKYPITAAVFGGIYTLGRIAYFLGYSTGNPKGRYKGVIWLVGSFGMLGTFCKFAFDLLRA